MTKNMHPLLAKRDHQAIQMRLQTLMKRDGLDALILVKPQSIAYATGYSSMVGYWVGTPAGVQSIAVIPAQGNPHLFLGLMERDDAKSQTVDAIEVHSLPGFVFVDDGTPECRQERGGTVDELAGFKQAVKLAMDSAPNAKIGVEKGVLIPPLMAVLEKQVGNINSTDCTNLMFEARIIKTPWEIDMLRLAAQNSERAMARVCKQLQPGMNAMVIDQMFNLAYHTEDEHHTAWKTIYQTGVGPFWGICMLPRNYVIQKGDIARIDGGAMHFGYVSDIARIWAVGGSPGPKHVETHAALYAGFLKGIKMLRPGVKMSEVYATVRAEVQKCPLIPVYARGHVGHSVSLEPTLEDVPAMSAHMDVVLKPNMVVCLETSYMGAPGAPAPGPYNIEDTFLITQDGHDRFTTAPDSLEWNPAA